MKTKDLTLGDILVFQKASYGSNYPAQVLDNALWTEIAEWVDNPEGDGRIEMKHLRPAKQGERAKEAGYWSYRETGIPVLQIYADYYRWMDTTSEESRFVTPVGDIFRDACKQFGAEQASDFAGYRPKSLGWRRVDVVVEFADGKKGSVGVSVELVRPQALKQAWNSFLKEKIQAEEARQALEQRRVTEKARRDTVGASVAERLDTLLGEVPRYWLGHIDRQDCHRESGSGGNFKITEETLLRLLELAEKSSQS